MLVAVVATGLHLLHHQLAQPVLQWALTLHVDLGNYYVRTLLAKLLGDLGVRSCNNTFRLTRREAMQNARPDSLHSEPPLDSGSHINAPAECSVSEHSPKAAYVHPVRSSRWLGDEPTMLLRLICCPHIPHGPR